MSGSSSHTIADRLVEAVGAGKIGTQAMGSCSVWELLYALTDADR
jgi:hypothetical protein